MKVGLVGCGRIGAMYADHLRALGHDDLICLDVDSARAAELARSGGTVAGSLAELLATGVDAALVAAATSSHPGLVSALLRAGVPTFCEKPLATDLAQTERLGQLASSRDVPLWVGFQRRFDPGFAELHAKLAAGDLGRVHLLRLISHDVAPPPLARLRESGSVFVDLMLHDFDLVQWLTGRRVVRVVGDGAVLAVPELAELGDFDTVSAMLRLEDGALAVLTAGRRQPLGYDVRAEVLGERGSAAAGLVEGTPVQALGPGAIPCGERGYDGYWDRFAEAYREQLDRFLVAAAGGPDTPEAGSWRSSYRAQRIALAAEWSARAGSIPVTL
ncbi:MAG: Gfo/Idh/MocA family protein [Pseudonocardiaceae bacterium]